MLDDRRDIPKHNYAQAAADVSDALDAALEMTSPASDPVAVSSATERLVARTRPPQPLDRRIHAASRSGEASARP